MTLITKMFIVGILIHQKTRKFMHEKYNQNKAQRFFKNPTRQSIGTVLIYPNGRCTCSSQNLESVPLLIMCPANILTVKVICFWKCRTEIDID